MTTSCGFGRWKAPPFTENWRSIAQVVGLTNVSAALPRSISTSAPPRCGCDGNTTSLEMVCDPMLAVEWMQSPRTSPPCVLSSETLVDRVGDVRAEDGEPGCCRRRQTDRRRLPPRRAAAACRPPPPAARGARRCRRPRCPLRRRPPRAPSRRAGRASPPRPRRRAVPARRRRRATGACEPAPSHPACRRRHRPCRSPLPLSVAGEAALQPARAAAVTRKTIHRETRCICRRSFVLFMVLGERD